MSSTDNYLVVENKVDIAKNKSDISYNKDTIDKNKKELDELKKQVSSNRRILNIMVVFVVVFCFVIFLNGMFVHYQTGLDEVENQVFQGDLQVGNLEI